MSDEQAETGGVTRLSFIKGSAGVAAGMAAIGVPGAALIAGEHGSGAQPTTPTVPTPPEPVVAYIRDAKRGEVSITRGTSEVTYRDRALVRRLLAAAPQSANVDGGINVIAP
jgi:hypothetical protein